MSLRIFLTSLTALLISFTSGWSETISQYDRDLFGGWADFDKDCQNTRHELLQELSTSTFTLNDRQCRVLRGRWYDPYTDRFFTGKDVDIDHLALSMLGREAHTPGNLMNDVNLQTILEIYLL